MGYDGIGVLARSYRLTNGRTKDVGGNIKSFVEVLEVLGKSWRIADTGLGANRKPRSIALRWGYYLNHSGESLRTLAISIASNKGINPHTPLLTSRHLTSQKADTVKLSAGKT